MIVPAETTLTAPYWAAARRGRVLLQRCAICARVWHPPAPVCPQCRGTSWKWEPASGAAELMSWTRVTHAVHPQISGSVPYLVALVRLVEGPLFVCGLDHDGDDPELVDAAPVTIEIGLAAGGLRLPIARCVPRGPRAEAGPDRPGSP